MLLRLCDILTVKTVKRIRPIRGSALVHITTLVPQNSLELHLHVRKERITETLIMSLKEQHTMTWELGCALAKNKLCTGNCILFKYKNKPFHAIYISSIPYTHTNCLCTFYTQVVHRRSCWSEETPVGFGTSWFLIGCPCRTWWNMTSTSTT